MILGNKFFDWTIMGGATTKRNKQIFKMDQNFVYFLNHIWPFYIC